MELELRHLRVICRVADTGSVSKAAASFNVSQPSLATQLRRIEAIVGGELFERSVRGVTPTALGKHILGRARVVLADMEDMVASSSKYVGSGGPLRLGSVSTVMFAAWLHRLEDQLDGRKIRAQVDPSCGTLTDLLDADALDITMLMLCDEAHAPPCPLGIHERTMVDPEPILIIMAADHPLANRSAITLTDLVDETWLMPPGGKRDGNLAAQRAACEAVGFTPKFRHDELGDAEVEQFLSAGRGIATCAPTVGSIPNTVVLPLVDQSLGLRRVLRWRPERVPSQLVDVIHQAFIDAYQEVLTTRLPNYPWWHTTPSTHPTIHKPPPRSQP
ncbi:LysR family transcriptional regulator [Kribbella sp. CA-294648]|uniref:LysR family transcriptional regulator n=1 Tax=Kribbella sp. CA-294648 TaxID=3239948 RepID=UPI003D91AEAC